MIKNGRYFNGLIQLVPCLVLVLASADSCTTSAAILRVPESYATIQAAINAAQPGDTVRVAPGVYNESIMTYRNGTSANPITIDGQNKAKIKQVMLRHAYNILQNFTISGATGQLVYLDRGASSCVITNNRIDVNYVTGTYGIRWGAPATPPFGVPVASGVHIISNIIEHVGGYIAIAIYGDNNVIERNFIRDCPQSDAFNVFGRSNVISANICSNFPSSTISANHSDFIQTFGSHGYGSRHILVESNLVIGVPDGGKTLFALNQLSSVLCPDISDWVFRNNVFINVGIQGSCSVPNVKYYNNTFVRCSFSSGGTVINFASRPYNGTGYQGASGTDYPHGGEVINNVFLDCGSIGGANNNITGWYFFTADLTNIIADYNFVSKNGYQPVSTDSQFRWIGHPSGWSNYAWWEPHGMNGGNPMFIDESKLDFRLMEESPLVEKALPLNHVFKTDMRGTKRGEKWDMGALEYQDAMAPLPPSNLRVLSE